ncbi:MAG: DUF502 domain-containing protein [Planctomycetes bacterium]|nr:DUF502 domain-containing protein [Planctomycetota bacterium]
MSQDAQPEVPNETPAPPKKGRLSLKRAFLTGLAALLPTALSVVILVWIIRFVHTYVAGPINGLIIRIVAIFLSGDGTSAHKLFHGDNRLHVDFAFSGYVVAFAAIFLVGFALLTIFGRKLYRTIDGILSRIPVLKMIYPHLKQLTEFIFDDDKASSFRQVVMIEYPRSGLWSMGFVTGPAMEALRKAKGYDLVSVFIPSSPTPFTGYVVAVRKHEIVEIPITVDQALRFSISGGVLVPPDQRAEGSGSVVPGPQPPDRMS